MERMTKEELVKLKDFKLYVFEWEVYVKAEDYKEKAIENKELNEKVRFLEECLDRKEKLNEKYRKELEELKSTYVYDAKQVRDIC